MFAPEQADPVWEGGRAYRRYVYVTCARRSCHRPYKSERIVKALSHSRSPKLGRLDAVLDALTIDGLYRASRKVDGYTTSSLCDWMATS